MPDTETMEQVRRMAQERLCPSLTNPNWLILRERRKLFQRWLGGLSSQGLWVLDVGGRIQPYQIFLAAKCAQYISVDLRATPLVDVVGRAEQLPFPDEKFDVVLCTQVLEYVKEPPVVLAEIYRVLKSGGMFLLSAPAVFPRDSEDEYWRFLPAALRLLLASFSSIEVAPEGNSVVGFIRTVNVCLVTFGKPAILRSLLRFTMVPLLNLFGSVVQLVSSSGDDRFSANFSVLAKK
jgi:SAM-dependent methyltransferase